MTIINFCLFCFVRLSTNVFIYIFQVQKRISDFIKDAEQQKFKFDVMDKVYRAVVYALSNLFYID